MKFLIWFFCLFVAAAISTLCRMGGIILGGLPTLFLYGGAFWLASYLCKRLDSTNEESVVKEGGQNSEKDTSDSEHSNTVTLTLPSDISSTIIVRDLPTDKVLWEGTSGEKIQFEVYGETNILVTWSKYSVTYTVCGGKMYELTDKGLWHTKWEIIQL